MICFEAYFLQTIFCYPFCFSRGKIEIFLTSPSTASTYKMHCAADQLSTTWIIIINVRNNNNNDFETMGTKTFNHRCTVTDQLLFPFKINSQTKLNKFFFQWAIFCHTVHQRSLLRSFSSHLWSTRESEADLVSVKAPTTGTLLWYTCKFITHTFLSISRTFLPQFRNEMPIRFLITLFKTITDPLHFP